MTPLLSRAAPHALILSMAAFVLVLAALEPAFLSGPNLIGILRSVALTGIMALGMTFVIMTGGIDLSVGPVSAIAGLVAYFTLLAGHGVAAALLAGATLGLMIGIANGLLVASLGLPAIIVTLGSLSVVRGSALLLGGPDLHGIRDQPAYSFIGSGTLGGMPVPVLVFLALSVLILFVQRRTPFGTLVAAVGDNDRAARLSGLRVSAIRAATYGLCGLLAAIAGMIQSSQVHTASATYGKFGTELDVIAAVVLGGTQLSGGAGSVARTVLGVLFLGILNNGMNILNVSIDIQLIAKGIIIALALSLAARRAG
jgi:ribose/xylose/arabinose/galactoside ABC-type transport system permease subunit